VWEWNPKTRQKRILLEGIRDISLDRDGRNLIGRSGESGTIVVYDLKQGKSTPLAMQPSRVFSMSLDPSGTIAATGDRVGCVRVGKVNGDHPHMLTVDGLVVTSVSVSPGGRWIASGHADGTIRVWSMPDITRPPLHTLPRGELLKKLRSLTNLRVVPDPDNRDGFLVRSGPFPGWETVPEW
jgi:WD40 repeat protein